MSTQIANNSATVHYIKIKGSIALTIHNGEFPNTIYCECKSPGLEITVVASPSSEMRTIVFNTPQSPETNEGEDNPRNTQNVFGGQSSQINNPKGIVVMGGSNMTFNINGKGDVEIITEDSTDLPKATLFVPLGWRGTVSVVGITSQVINNTKNTYVTVESFR